MFDVLERWFGGSDEQTARVFDLQPGDRITDVDIVESGVEVSLSGEGPGLIHGLDVRILDASDAVVYSGTPYDSSFRISGLDSGTYRLQASGTCVDQNWEPQWYGGDSSPGSAAPIELGAGELRAVSMTLVAGGSISGSIVDPSTNGPGAYCGLFDSEGEPLCSRFGTWYAWEEDGAFHYPGLADGDYYLALRNHNDPENGPWWYPGTATLEEAVPITITDHADVTGIVWTAVLPRENGR